MEAAAGTESGCDAVREASIPPHGQRGGVHIRVVHRGTTPAGYPSSANGTRLPVAVERFIGTVKRGLKEEPLTSDKDFEAKLTSIRLWYNHDRPHDHLQGRTPAEVWAGIDVLKARSS